MNADAVALHGPFSRACPKSRASDRRDFAIGAEQQTRRKKCLRNFAFGLLAATLVAGPGFAATSPRAAPAKLTPLPLPPHPRLRPRPRKIVNFEPPNKADQDGQTHPLALCRSASGAPGQARDDEAFAARRVREASPSSLPISPNRGRCATLRSRPRRRSPLRRAPAGKVRRSRPGLRAFLRGRRSSASRTRSVPPAAAAHIAPRSRTNRTCREGSGGHPNRRPPIILGR